MNIQDLVNEIESGFEAHKNQENAHFMAKYMKYKFPFYGIKSAQRKQIVKNAIKPHKDFVSEHRFDLVFAFLDKSEREWHQAAVDILLEFQKKNTRENLPDLERILLTHSWWDTVDLVATNLIGALFLREKDVIPEWISRWRNHNSIWLNRACIIFQLKYKKVLNKDLLADLAIQFSDSNEFFIQKALGWMFREYSKTNPNWVQLWVSTHSLKPLSKREALRYLKQKN